MVPPAAPSFSLAGKVILQSGGTGNLGRTLVTALAASGATVVVASRDASKLEGQVANEHAAGRTVFVAGGTTAQNSSFSNLGPLPTEHNGVPIVASEWILNTEAIETPA